MATYAIKGDEKILVTPENKSSLIGYKFINLDISKKDGDILKLKELSQSGVENDSRYKTTQGIPDELDPNKQEKLKILDKRGKEITMEYLKLESEVIKKYGIEILELI